MARSLAAVSFRRIATVEHAVTAGIHTHTHTHTHTHSQLYRIPRAATPRGKNMSSNRGKTYCIAVKIKFSFRLRSTLLLPATPMQHMQLAK